MAARVKVEIKPPDCQMVVIVWTFECTTRIQGGLVSSFCGSISEPLDAMGVCPFVTGISDPGLLKSRVGCVHEWLENSDLHVPVLVLDGANRVIEGDDRPRTDFNSSTVDPLEVKKVWKASLKAVLRIELKCKLSFNGQTPLNQSCSGVL